MTLKNFLIYYSYLSGYLSAKRRKGAGIIIKHKPMVMFFQDEDENMKDDDDKMDDDDDMASDDDADEAEDGDSEAEENM